MRLLERLKYPIITALAFLVVGFYALVTFNLSVLGPVARALKSIDMTDIYCQIQQATREPLDCHLITIVDMTDLISRSDLARTLEEIEAAGPKVIGVDMIFQGHKEDKHGDEWIGSVSQLYDNIVYSCKLEGFSVKEQEYTGVKRSFFADDVSPKQGFTNMPRNDLYDDMKRVVAVGRMLNGEPTPSFVTQVCNMYASQDIVPLTTKNININYQPTRFDVIKADEVAEHPELIEDRIVLFGAMNEETDMHYTPLGKIPGVEVLAYSILTVANEKEVVNVPKDLMWLSSFLIVMATLAWTKWYRRKIEKECHYAFWRVLLTSIIVMGFLRFLWMALFTLFGFLLFHVFHVSLNLGWAFSGIAFLLTGESFYNIIAAKAEDLSQRKKTEITDQNK